MLDIRSTLDSFGQEKTPGTSLEITVIVDVSVVNGGGFINKSWF